ncbi:MAG: hypothetical protein HY327_03750 [Chloroflexi bacterium]|nr:hypothetical protein [Chloroflexota bacterium]
MSIDDYLEALNAKLRKISALVVSSAVQREIDENLGIGFIKGQINFVDGSRLEFTEQLPIERHKYRIHLMDATNTLIVRWDSAPHHRDLDSFPYHLHTPKNVEAHSAINLLEALDVIVRIIKT